MPGAVYPGKVKEIIVHAHFIQPALLFYDLLYPEPFMHEEQISRYIYQEVPPKVEYSLTELGKSFIPILREMKKWSDTHLM